MQEIERKYLLNDSILPFLKNLHPICKNYTQFYTKITPDESLRYRKEGKHYYQTYKQGKGAIRKEIEKEIDGKYYHKKLDKYIGNLIKKERCLIKIENKEYSIDNYKEQLKSLIVMEIEFPNIQDYKKYKLPSILQKFIKKEVTMDECYKNKNLALFGLPLDDKDHKRIDHVLAKLLQKQYEAIKTYRQKVCKGDDEEDLHQLRIALRKSITLIAASKFMFEDNSWREHKIFLKQVISLTNEKRDLDVFKHTLKQQQIHYKTPLFVNAVYSLNHKIEDKLQDENKKIISSLQSPYFDKGFINYQAFIMDMFKKNESVYGAYHSQKIAKYMLYKYNKKMKILMYQYKSNHNEELLHTIRIIFKKLRYILESFRDFFHKKEILLTIKNIKQIQTSLGIFHDICEQKRILLDFLGECKDENIVFVIENGLLPGLKNFRKKELKEIERTIDDFIEKHQNYCSCFTYIVK